MLSISNNLLSKNRQLLSVLQKSFATSSITETIQNVTIIGGGVMGAGIAQVSAQSRFNVTVVDTDEYSQKCMVSVIKSSNIISKKKFPHEPRLAQKFIDDVLANIKTTQSLKEGVKNADLVIEAVIEDINIKKDLFKKIDVLAPANTVFTSNTSSYSIQEMADVTTRADRFGGMHFFNPVYKMKLVEVIACDETSEGTMDKMSSFVKEIGKVSVKLKDSKETTGFIVNSLLLPYLMEALRFLERGHATMEDIDTAMKLGTGLPSGPFEIIDIIGIDTMKYIMDHWHENYPDNPKFYPCEILNDLYIQKKLGRKTAQGFYSYRHKLY